MIRIEPIGEQADYEHLLIIADQPDIPRLVQNVMPILLAELAKRGEQVAI